MEVSTEVSHLEFREAATSAPSASCTVSGEKTNDEDGGEKETKLVKKRKPRRFKYRTKGRYSPYKNISVEGTKPKVHSEAAAPNNTTQFLMAYHHDLENLDSKLLNNVESKARVRDNSLTSGDGDSDDESYFYSSPEEEQEFLDKDFQNTYTTIYEEELTRLPKNRLIEIIINLEDRVDNLEKKLRSKNGAEEIPVAVEGTGTDTDNSSLECQFKRLLAENERLLNENKKLKETVQSSLSASSSSSSSLTSSSSSSSSGDCSDTEEENYIELSVEAEKGNATELSCEENLHGNELLVEDHNGIAKPLIQENSNTGVPKVEEANIGSTG